MSSDTPKKPEPEGPEPVEDKELEVKEPEEYEPDYDKEMPEPEEEEEPEVEEFLEDLNALNVPVHRFSQALKVTTENGISQIAVQINRKKFTDAVHQWSRNSSIKEADLFDYENVPFFYKELEEEFYKWLRVNNYDEVDTSSFILLFQAQWEFFKLVNHC